MKIFLGYFIIVIYVSLILLLCRYLHRTLNIQIKYTRKIGHISLGALWSIQYYFFGITIHMLIPIIIFTIANIIAFRFNFLVGIEYKNKKQNYGTIYFTIAMLLLSIMQFFMPKLILPVGIAYFCLTLGDGLAAIVGYSFKKFNFVLCGKKTLIGSISMWVSSVVVVISFNNLFDIELSIWSILAISSIACLTELYTPYGLDNVTLPILGTMTTYLIIYHWPPLPILVLLSIAPALHFLILIKKIFTPGANITSLIYMVILTLCLKWMAFVLLFVPFCIDAIVTLIKKHCTQQGRISHINSKEKHGRRSSQVLCNGIVALLFAIAHYIFKEPIFLYIVIICIAEAFGDTMASDIGEMSKSSPIDICTRKPIANGLSGGITTLGCVSAMFAIVLLEALMTPWVNFALTTFLIVFLTALFGVVLDSILGSIIQAKYRCCVCQKIIEAPLHCEKQSILIKGKSYITNSIVNLVSNTISAFLGCVVFLIVC